MKIIGKTGSGFIIVADENELAKIMGFYSTSSMDANARPAIGLEVKVSALYAALSVSRERRKEIADLANKLRTAAGRVDSINQALADPIIEVEVGK